MIPEIAALDQALAYTGRAVTVRRRVGKSDSFVQIGMLAQVRGYDPHELSGSVFVDDTKLIVSPSSFRAVDFGGAGGRQWPRKGDEVMHDDGRWSRVEACKPIMVGNSIVRLEIQARG